MKNRALFSSKDKSKNLKCCLLQFLFGTLRINVLFQFWNSDYLTLLHSEWPKLHRVLAILSAIGSRSMGTYYVMFFQRETAFVTLCLESLKKKYVILL